jgi:hypothetical protein
MSPWHCALLSGAMWLTSDPDDVAAVDPRLALIAL